MDYKKELIELLQDNFLNKEIPDMFQLTNDRIVSISAISDVYTYKDYATITLHSHDEDGHDYFKIPLDTWRRLAQYINIKDLRSEENA